MNKIATRRVSNAFIVGLFVTISILVIVAAVIWLGANQFFRENRYYVTYFSGSIEGLETGSAVKYQGVPVGSITKIGIAPDGNLIEVTMQIEKDVEITPKMRVKLEFAGIAGGRFLQLHYPEKKEFYYQHPQLSFKPPYKVIPSAPSGLAEIEFAAKDMLNNLNRIDAGAISENAVRFLNSTSNFVENKELYETVTSLKNATATLADVLQKADSSAIIHNVQGVTERLLRTSNELETFGKTMNKKLDAIDVASHLDSIVARYDTLITVIQANVNSLSYQGRSTMLMLNETLDQFKLTAKDLRKALRNVSDTPSQIFLSKPPEKDK